MEAVNPSSLRPWREEYEALQAFVQAHETIRVTPTSLRIPKELREEFYARIDCIEISLAEQILGERLKSTEALAQKLAAVRNDIVENSNLRAYRLPATLENLIRQPAQAAARPILGLVLDALQTGLAPAELEDRASQLLFPFLQDMSRAAYETWAYLTILRAWKPKTFYGIVTQDTIRLTFSETDQVILGYQVTHPERRLPDQIFETQDGRVLAVKLEVGLELDYYGEKVSREKGYSANGNTADEIAHRVLLAYEFPSVQSVDALADGGKSFVRPVGLMCTFLLPREMENEYLASTFAQHLRSVRSLRPVQLLTFDETGAFPTALAEDRTIPKFERTAVAYDSQKLENIASKLYL